MADRPIDKHIPPGEEGRETALIVQPVLPAQYKDGKAPYMEPEEQLAEAEGLVQAIFLDICATRIVNLKRVSPALLIGKGAAEDIAALVEECEPSVVVVNHPLSPVQQRNLEKKWDAKVIDRTGLILEIFGERAQTKEGRIQVELAALEYQKSRLVRSWTHLERQRGGAGFMGGPGERQIELDRRIITERITRLKKDLEHLRQNRDLQRRSRERVPYPVVALVGYTNAGKSTLFNYLTGAQVFAKDLLFATLDPTMRKVTLDDGKDIILSDTVGFIADLPTHLIAAFRATLEQTEYADIILHVRDISHAETEGHRQDVIEILGQLGIDYESDRRIIEVWNKTDRLEQEEKADLMRKASFAPNIIALSALTGEGCEALLARIEEILGENDTRLEFDLNAADGEALAWLYNKGKVTAREDKEDRILLTVELNQADRGRFKQRFGYDPVNKDDRKKTIRNAS